jgi:hypothetical protein
LSVEAVQVSVAASQTTLLTTRPPGGVGGWLSAAAVDHFWFEPWLHVQICTTA